MQNQKTRVTVRIAGKDYTIASYDPPEYVNRVVGYVDRKMNELSLATRLPAGQLAVLAAVSATDDMMKSRDELDQLRREVLTLNEALEQARTDLASRDAELERLNRALEQARADIASRDAEIERLNCALEQARADMTSRDAEIERLNCVLEARETHE